MKKIPVAIAFDENYLMPACVMLTSLFENAFETTTYEVNVYITSEIAVLAEPKFKELFSTYPRHKYRFVDPQGAFSKTAQNKGHLTTPNYYRFLMPALIQDYKKAFWIDVDIIVEKDLTELYETDLGENYLAAVAVGNPEAKVSGIPFGKYYNAGFMLLNLELWRRDGVADKISKLISETEFNCPTQDPCNLVTYGKTHYLPFKYNTLISKNNIENQDVFLEFHNLESFDKAVENATILHFTDKTKPWIYRNQPFADEWMAYYKKSNYKDIPLRLKWLFTEKVKRFLYQKKRTTKKRTIIKICKIPVYIGKTDSQSS
jgi:lipopolysaccharide biosynthesis glycosyltransferase